MKGIKIAGRIFGWLTNAVLLFLLLCNIYTIGVRHVTGTLQPDVFGWSWAVVISGSMEPEIGIDDLIIVKEKKEYHINDVVSYESGSSVVTHRIVEEGPNGYTTQGDANNTIDTSILSKSKIIGKVEFVIPNAGRLIRYLQSPLGMTCLVLIGFLIIEIPYLIEKGRREKGARGKHEVI